jgi:hypothetical protein
MSNRQSCALDVFSFREGLLSRFGHDLLLRVPATVEIEMHSTTLDVSVSADFNPIALVGAVRDGRVDETLLSPSDRAKVLTTLRNEILGPRNIVDAQFRAQLTLPLRTQALTGTLTLAGRQAPVEVDLRIDGDEIEACAEFKPSRWGIAPYRAMAGALKVADRLRVVGKISFPHA